MSAPTIQEEEIKPEPLNENTSNTSSKAKEMMEEKEEDPVVSRRRRPNVVLREGFKVSTEKSVSPLANQFQLENLN